MARISVALKIDVTKIDKSKLFKGAKGTYLDASVFIDLDNEDQYGNHGMITQQVSKEDREVGIKGAILGNGKIVWRDEQQAPQQKPQAPRTHSAPPPPQFDDEGQDIPF